MPFGYVHQRSSCIAERFYVEIFSTHTSHVDFSPFGVFLQDPLESDGGWTNAGYFVTGCSKEWISVELVDKINDVAEEVPGEEIEEDVAPVIDNFVEEGLGEVSTASHTTRIIFSNFLLTFLLTIYFV